MRVQLGFNGDPLYSPRCYATLRAPNRRKGLALACGASSSSPPFCGVRGVFKFALNSGEVTLHWALLRLSAVRLVSGNAAAPWLGEAWLLRVGIVVELPRVPVIFRRTPVNPATGARTRGNREGRRVARVRACVPGPAGVRERSGGPYRRRPLSGGAATVWSSV